MDRFFVCFSPFSFLSHRVLNATPSVPSVPCAGPSVRPSTSQLVLQGPAYRSDRLRARVEANLCSDWTWTGEGHFRNEILFQNVKALQDLGGGRGFAEGISFGVH